jgi:hypothetical protein
VVGAILVEESRERRGEAVGAIESSAARFREVERVIVALRRS